jgi:hypothetical protein
MKRLAVVLCCLLCEVAAAAGVDDALTAVHEAQRAIEGDASCKSLPTKLKVSLEALEKAHKSPVPANVQQAKGRVETAKDFVAGACSEAVRAKVTEQLTAAIAALDKAAEPEKKEKQGAAFNTACHGNDECASDHCYVGASGDGYCSKLCTAPGDCPAQWTCRRPGSAPDTICIKP